MSALKYSKSWKSFAQQLELLRSRGMHIPDEKSALHALERIGYYRLSGYFYPFRPDSEQGSESGADKGEAYYPETSFNDVVKLYQFDKKVRLLLLDALESIQVKLRVEIAYLLGKDDCFAHTRKDEFWDKFTRNPREGSSRFDKLYKKNWQLLENSSEDFVKHYQKKYGPDEPLPIWVACEIWDFGTMVNVFRGILRTHQKKISTKYGVEEAWVFCSWLGALNVLRNYAAHFCRLWNRNFPSGTQPELPVPGKIDWCDNFLGRKELMRKPFLLFSITRHLMKVIEPDGCWPGQMKRHLLNFPQLDSHGTVSRHNMGVVNGWQNWW